MNLLQFHKKQMDIIMKKIGAQEESEFEKYQKKGREVCLDAGLQEWEEITMWGHENGVGLDTLVEDWETANVQEIEDWETKQSALKD